MLMERVISPVLDAYHGWNKPGVWRNGETNEQIRRRTYEADSYIDSCFDILARMEGQLPMRRFVFSMKYLFWFMAIWLISISCAIPEPDQQTIEKTYPGLSFGPLSSAKMATLPKGTILKSNDLVITQKDLEAKIREFPSDLWPQLKRNLFYVLENKFAESMITREAQSWASGVHNAPKEEKALVAAYFDSLTKDTSVTDDELQDFYTKNKDMMGGASFEEIKSQLRDYLLQEKRSQIVQTRINSLSDRYQVELDGEWVAKQYSAAIDNPVDKARKSGRPSLVDFGADGCRPCDMMTPILESLKKEYADKLNVVFVHVRKEQILAARYKVQSIPVQVFFDKDGKEVFRHVGFFPKDQITMKLAEMGVK